VSTLANLQRFDRLPKWWPRPGLCVQANFGFGRGEKVMWKKVVGPTLLVSLLWLTISGATNIYIQWVSTSHERLLRENVASIRAAGAMQAVLWRMQAFALEFDADGNGTDRAQLTEVEAEFERALVAAEQAASTSVGLSVLKTIRQRFSLYRDHVHHGLQRLIGPAPEPFPAAETLQLARAVADPCKELLTDNDRVIQTRSASESRLLQGVRLTRLIFIVVGPAIGLLLGFAVSRNLRRSISQIHVTLQDASNDLPHEVGQIEVSDVPDLPGLHQRVQEMVVRFRDVMQDLQQARRDAVRSERLAAVGELAAGVAHELRNPLTSVKLLIQMAVQRGSSQALGERQLQVVIDEIARMETTIQGLLDFARPPTLRRVRQDLRETLQSAINLIEGRSQQQKVAVAADFPSRPVWLKADPDQLQQVFVNLLLNGIEAMPQGGVLNVKIDDADANSGICRVRFADSGCGIPDTILERMFEPFVTSKERGTGLGLAVSRRIVEEHGGILLAANQESAGAIFTVELPREEPPDAVRPDAAISTAGEAS
jgi:two-component system sensor histidine kinase HydH